MDIAGGPVREAMVVLGAAAIVIPLFHRLRLSPVLGFMLVGLLAGPSGLGALHDRAPWLAAFTIGDRERIEPVAELGVVLLLFTIGLELSLPRIKALRGLVFGLGAAQVALSAAAIAGAAWVLSVPLGGAVVLGLALAMSSTAVVVQVLSDERRLSGVVGRSALAVLLFQDVSVVPVMFVLGVLGMGAGPADLALAAGKAIAAVALLAGLGRVVLRPLFRGVARTRSPELFMAACLLVVLATGVAATAAGLSMALGALLAGLLLAETEYRRQIEVTIEPFKGLLLGVFLISVGMQLDLRLFLAHPVGLLGGALLLVAAKMAVVVLAGRGMRLPARVAIPAGLLLGPGGEFSFVVLGTGTATGVLDPAPAALAYAVAALTMASIPALSWVGRRLFPAARAPIDPALLPPDHADDAPRVVVAGFGRVGQTVAALLDVHGLPWVALDADVRAVARARRAGKPVFYGEVTQELLRRVGLESARAVVVTVDEAADEIVVAARAVNPGLLVVVRARDATHAARLYGLGASDAVPETIEASLQLGEAVLVDLGVPMGPVLVSIHEKRAEFQAEIKAHAPDAQVRPRGGVRLRG